MSNRITIQIREERSLNKDLKPMEEFSKSVYISSDEITSYIGTIKNVDDLHSIIAPENILEAIENNLSEYESEIILGVLMFSKCYHLGDEVFHINI